MQLRNIAIIAHVDHGKTTLVDHLLKQCNIFRADQEVPDCVLDSNDLERERGITILAKNISVNYKGVKINIIDTPGHSDFGGEVERVLKMADGVLLLVDSFEGSMPQTRFVLQKALSYNLKPIVVINKMDKPNRRPKEVINEVYDLFIDLGADDTQLDFPVLYASGRDGWAALQPDIKGFDLSPLLDTVVESIPAPTINEGPFQMQVTKIDYSDYVGRIAIGRVFRGHIKPNMPVAILKHDGSQLKSSFKDIYLFEGLARTKADIVQCGDICALMGVDEIDIGDTIADAENPEPLPIIKVDEPTMSMMFYINDSPLFGKEGKYVTSRHLRERLFKELKSNVALKVEESTSGEYIKVFGRGILHLSILIETMRREGYEFQVGQPKVIYKEINGKKAEPIEDLIVDVPSDLSGRVIEAVSKKRGELKKVDNIAGRSRLEFHIPARGIIGLRNKLLNATSGEAIINHQFYQYEYFKGSIPHRTNGVLISMAAGEAVAYGLDALQARGKFFISPGDYVYEGQVIGESNKEGDLVVNAQKSKKLTNMRASGSDDAVKLIPPTLFSLEEALEYVNEDELVEITPLSIRLRKRILTEIDRKRAGREERAD